jgi:hypothetical protein
MSWACNLECKQQTVNKPYEQKTICTNLQAVKAVLF